MMEVNWKVRLKNKAFWIALIPAVVMLIEVGVAIFGVKLDLGDIGRKIVAFVNVVFSVLVILGVVNDPTTQGLCDSKEAMNYENPKLKEKVKK